MGRTKQVVAVLEARKLEGFKYFAELDDLFERLHPLGSANDAGSA